MRLLEPITLGSADLRNRLVFGPHETNLANARAIGARHVDYYRRRAAGGCALIVTEEASVHASDWPYERAPLAAECGPGWTDVAAACADEGAVVVAAVGHSGLQGSSAYSQRELWAPSLVADAVTRELPKEMEVEDIEQVLAGFEAAAAAAMASGMAGVEVNAGQHSLVRQFVSGLTNLRDDEWGEAADGTGRLRFAHEVLGRVRQAVGDGLVGLRLSCDELAPWAGLTPDAGSGVAASLVDHVDYIVVVRGSIFSVDATRPEANVEAGFNLGLVEQVRAAVDPRVAVVAQGSIIDPGQAEWALTDGRAELIEMTRAQIADPDLATRVAAGERPRPCLLCNQRCRVRDARNPIVTCVVNPSAGYEATEPEAPTTPDRTRSFAVIGAGPAGLELARLLAEAGHEVTVLDRGDEPGGAVPGWAHGPRAPLATIVDWLRDECDRLGVVTELGREVGTADIAALEAAGHEVVLCTGGRAGRRDYLVADGATVTSAAEVLAQLRTEPEAAPDGPLVVWDPIGGPIAISLALMLARAGRDVSLVTPDVVAGTQLASTGDLAAASTRLLAAGVEIVKRQVLRSVSPGSVELEDRFSGGRTALPAAVLVDAGHRLPDDHLWQATDGRLPRAGDCVAPRTIFEAILEGRRAAVALASARPEAERPVTV